MSQTAFRPDSSTDLQSRPAWRLDMPWWAWPLTAVGVALTLAFEVVFWWFTEFGFASCGTPVDRGDMHDGQLLLAALWGGVSLVWWVAAWLSRLRVPVVVAGLLCSVAAAAIFGHGLDPGAWTDGFCF
jgi:hypothetical protein